jgi:hypothetical protein
MLANVPPTNDRSARRLVPATTPGGDDGGSAPRC